MITRNKNLAKLYTLALAVAGLLSSAGAFAAVTVSCGDNTDSNCTSAVTGGRWDQNFGNDAHKTASTCYLSTLIAILRHR